MNLDIQSPIGHAGSFQPIDTRLKEAMSRTPVAVQMNLETLAALVASVVATAAQPAREGGQGRPAPAVQLRQPALTDQAAQAVLAGVIITLPNLLAALATSIDPIQTEAGADTRAAEGAAVQSQPQARALTDGPAAATGTPATGTDADIGARSANLGGWLKSSPLSNLLVLLRQILLEFEKLDRDNSVKMVEMQRNLTIKAGELGVEKANIAMVAAITATVMTGVIGGAAVGKSYQSTKMQTDSLKLNHNAANKASITDANRSGGIARHNTPSDQLRAGRNVDGATPNATKGSARPDADIQADSDADLGAMNHTAKHSAVGSTAARLENMHTRDMALAQVPQSHALMLNMVGPAIGNSASAGINIEAEMTESERLLVQQNADVARRTADEQQDQSARNAEMRRSADQLVETLLRLFADTSGHIISKS